jgi:glycosyltransferase involved in cell wall biosynthesis
MKVAYVTMYDANDLKNWSGTAHHIARALERQGVEVTYIGSLEDRGGALLGLRRALTKVVGRKRLLRERDPKVAQAYAAQVEERLEGLDVDWIISPGTIPIAELAVSTPIAFWTDATFGQMIGVYPEFEHLSAATIRAGNTLEQHALDRATLAIYASEWAAQSAVHDYGADPAKVKVLPFGANLTGNRDLDAIDEIIRRRGTDVCRLLFVGVDWKRKGGDLAIAIAGALLDRGVRTELTIVGSTPEVPLRMRDIVNVRGFISKNSPSGSAEIEQLLAASHFLVAPTRAECFGVAFAEASSFALPSIASNVMAVPSVVTDGVNGFTFPLESIVADSASCMASLWVDRPRYERLCWSAFEESRHRLNWQASGRDLMLLLGEMHPSRTVLSEQPEGMAGAGSGQP